MLWTLRGKSAWETGAILGISEHTVAKILRSATGKLQASNKQSAAIKAMRLGLLDEEEGSALLRPPGRTDRQASPDRSAETGRRRAGWEAPGCDARSWSWVDLAPGVLAQLRFTHLATDCIEQAQAAPPGGPAPSSAAGSVFGRTTWRAPWHDATVRLQWTWAVGESGILLLEDPLRIRTNARLVPGSEDPRIERPMLLECMGVIHLLDWHEVVRAVAEKGEASA